MPTTSDRMPAPTRREPGTDPARSTLTRILVACGIVYSLTYAVANDVIAAWSYDGYSRMSQAVSELSATGAPTRTFLIAMLPLWTALMVAFGIGVIRAAAANRALRVTGGLLIAFGITGILWLPFPMTSRAEMVSGTTPANDVGHIVLTVVTVALILSQLAFGAAAFGRWFRLYSLATALTVLVFGLLTGREAPKVPDGDPTPWMGLYERINIGAWLLWISVLSVMVLRSLSSHPADPADEAAPPVGAHHLAPTA